MNQRKMNHDRNKITLRRATENDTELLILNRLAFLTDIHGEPAEELEKHLRKNLADYFPSALKSGAYISWIAEYENVPVGFSGMIIRIQPGNFDMPDGKSGYILNIFTLKEFRKMGIATMLMQRLIEESRRLKLDRVELRATPDGEKVYRKLGFREPHDQPMELPIR